jgi:hypothetical protein
MTKNFPSVKIKSKNVQIGQSLSDKRSPTLKLKVRLSLSGYIRNKTYLTIWSDDFHEATK